MHSEPKYFYITNILPQILYSNNTCGKKKTQKPTSQNSPANISYAFSAIHLQGQKNEFNCLIFKMAL